ncbi:Uncharacterized protein APZ42_001776, partial [Daphnia magna]
GESVLLLSTFLVDASEDVGIQFQLPELRNTYLDVKNRYYLAAEYMECRFCKRTIISYDSSLIQQLPYVLKFCFPTVLTRKLTADKVVVGLMRARTIGNSLTAVCRDICELHSKDLNYLADCARYKRNRESLGLASCRYEDPPPFSALPTAKWFLASYSHDAWSRLDHL